MTEKVSGVYKIINLNNQHFYVGSSNDIHGRWRGHKSLLRKNKHHSSRLQRAWNKYGESMFNFVIEIRCDNYKETEDIILKEHYGTTHCYNVCATSTGTTGYKHSESFKQYISKLNTGRVVTELTKKRLSKRRGITHHLTGKHLSTEHKEKIGKSHQGELSSTNKLSSDDVIKIRKLYEFCSQRELAKMYNVSRSCIKDIVTRKNWKHI